MGEFLDVSFAAKVFVIPDVYDRNEFFEKPKVHERKYCFTGGMNNRNWKIVVGLANFLTNVEFICVALKDDFERQVEKIPSNMHVYFDIPVEQYYFDESEKLLVQNDFENWKEQILVWFSYSEKEYCAKTEKFCSYIEHEFSPYNAAKKIKKLIVDYDR